VKILKPPQPQAVGSARREARGQLKAIHEKFGFVPNMMGTFANAPAVLAGYLALEAALEKSSLTAKEKQLALLTASVENRCLYCSAAHAKAARAVKVDNDAIQAVRSKAPLSDKRLDALVSFTREVVNGRGFVAETTKERFVHAGYDEAAMMDVLLCVALKTISNYLDHLNPVSIDPAFENET
jgi:uncharacterized peroxidase-related enzyme